MIWLYFKGLKLELGFVVQILIKLGTSSIQGFLQLSFDVLLGETYATCWWPHSDHWSVHLTSHHLPGLCGMEVWKLIGAICAVFPQNYDYCCCSIWFGPWTSKLSQLRVACGITCLNEDYRTSYYVLFTACVYYVFLFGPYHWSMTRAAKQSNSMINITYETISIAVIGKTCL